MDHSSGSPKLTLATRITLCRILGVPVYILLLIYYTMGLRQGSANELFRSGALLVFLMLAASDFLDGYIARTRNQITRLGTLLDPIADKLLMVSSLILLTRPSLSELQPQFPVVIAVLFISRDVFLVAGAFVVQHYCGQVHVKPRWSGKASTAAMVCCVAYILLGGPLRYFTPLLTVAAALILLSMVQYLMDGIRQLENASHQHHAKDQNV
ncbi:MAG: CDP-alcohol phosphatidyltransferase family protein [Kiritimatiellia bacterium]